VPVSASPNGESKPQMFSSLSSIPNGGEGRGEEVFQTESQHCGIQAVMMQLKRGTTSPLLRGRQDKLPIPTAPRAHPLRCSLGQRPLWASSLVRASRLHPWRSSLYVSYPTIPSVPSPPGAEREYFQRAGLNALSSIPNGGEGRGEEDFQTASFRLRRFDTFTQTQSSICCESQTRGPADSGSVSRSTVELRDRFPGVRKP